MAETFFFVYIIDLNEQIKIIKLSQSAVAQWNPKEFPNRMVPLHIF